MYYISILCILSVRPRAAFVSLPVGRLHNNNNNKTVRAARRNIAFKLCNGCDEIRACLAFLSFEVVTIIPSDTCEHDPTVRYNLQVRGFEFLH